MHDIRGTHEQSMTSVASKLASAASADRRPDRRAGRRWRRPRRRSQAARGLRFRGQQRPPHLAKKERKHGQNKSNISKHRAPDAPPPTRSPRLPRRPSRASARPPWTWAARPPRCPTRCWPAARPWRRASPGPPATRDKADMPIVFATEKQSWVKLQLCPLARGKLVRTCSIV